MKLFSIIITNLRTVDPINDWFLGLFLLLGLLILFFKALYPKRFGLNIKSPNIYIFEYEAQTGRWLSFYNTGFFIIKLWTYVLFSLALIYFYQQIISAKILDLILINKLFLTLLICLVAKLILEILYFILIKKINLLNKIRFIRAAFENYQAFYLFIISFLIFYSPVHSGVLFYLIVTLSILWWLIVLYNLYGSIKKHSDIKKYQIILYLCLSEILPFIVVIGWIIFQIL